MTDLLNFDNSIGTARDNRSKPVHDWYRFTAGFSYKLVDKIIKGEELAKGDTIYECFAGCGTTLVSAQNQGIKAIGNEGQELLFDVIRAKLNWNVDKNKILNELENIKINLRTNQKYDYHKLMISLYSEKDLSQLYSIKEQVFSISELDIMLFLKLALTQTLHKSSIHPISVPYISRNKTIRKDLSAFEIFEKIVFKMLDDIDKIKIVKQSSKIYLHDSRTKNENIFDNSCTISITSPPYLNNLDYGEVSKVCSHFFGLTNSWNDITEKVRKKLVTGATTHFKNKEFNIDNYKNTEFYYLNSSIVEPLFSLTEKIRLESYKRVGKKRFDILVLYYFEDMFKVLKEMRRIISANGKAYLVLGDSAPYGIFIDTTKVLGEIALSVGFKKYKIIKLRERGTKWKLRFRHNLKLSENLLILE